MVYLLCVGPGGLWCGLIGGRCPEAAQDPPVTLTAWPLMLPLAAEPRNTIVLATSSGVDRCWEASVLAFASSIGAGALRRTVSVRVWPGTTMFTRMFSGPRSQARLRSSP